MTARNKIKLVQALTGAIVLTLLMQLLTVFDNIALFGFTTWASKTWMCFLPLLMFFAFGANFKMIPQMLLCFFVGMVWCFLNGLLIGAFMAMAGGNPVLSVVVQILCTIFVIFCILTVHENFFEGAIFSNVPLIFMGMCTSFYMTEMGAVQDPMVFVQLYVLWVFGIILAVCLVIAGMKVCCAIFGEAAAMAALIPLPPEGAPDMPPADVPAPEVAPEE